MRYQFLLMVFIVCCATLLKGVEPAEVERIRKESIATAEGSTFSPELLKWWVKHISNDDEPLADEEIFKVFEKSVFDKNEQEKRIVYLYVALFRWRDRVDMILRLFDLVTPDERNCICALWWVPYRSLVKPQSFPAWKRMCLESFSTINDDAVPQDQRDAVFTLSELCLETALKVDREQAVAVLTPLCFPILKRRFSENLFIGSDGMLSEDHQQAAFDRSYSLLTMALMLDREQAVALAEDEIKRHVSDENVRKTLVHAVLQKGGHPALPLAEWYFRVYCSEPSEMLYVLDFLKKHVPADELKGIIQNRCNQLQETVDILLGKETPATERYRASLKTMEEKR